MSKREVWVVKRVTRNDGFMPFATGVSEVLVTYQYDQLTAMDILQTYRVVKYVPAEEKAE